MFDNQLSMMYHIEIAVEYWNWKYKETQANMNEETKKSKIKKNSMALLYPVRIGQSR